MPLQDHVMTAADHALREDRDSESRKKYRQYVLTTKKDRKKDKEEEEKEMTWEILLINSFYPTHFPSSSTNQINVSNPFS